MGKTRKRIAHDMSKHGMKKGNMHTTIFNVHCLFTDSQFAEGADPTPPGVLPNTGYTILCTAHAICDHFADLPDEEYSWLLLMAAAYVHRFCTDVAFDDKSFAMWFGMGEDAFAADFFTFLKIVYAMPPSLLNVRNNDPRRPAERNEFLGPVVKVYPFQL